MNKRNKIIVFVVLGIAIISGVVYYVNSLRYETSDDAQIDTDITAITSHVTGYIAKVNFKENTMVKAGDTLIVLDDRELALKEEQARVALENAEAMLQTTQEDVQSVRQDAAGAKVKIEESRIRVKNAAKDFDRYNKMYAKGSVTQQDYDRFRTNKEMLEKQLESAILSEKEIKANVNVATQRITVAQTVVEQRRVDLKFAQLNHSYAFITAPFDGKISKKNAVNGQLIQTGQALCSIVSNADVWVTANFKETQVEEMKPGMEVEVSVDAFPDDKIQGTVASFSSATGAKFSLIPPDNATGNFVKVVQRIPVRIDLDKSNPIYKNITPGMNVVVKVKLHD